MSSGGISQVSSTLFDRCRLASAKCSEKCFGDNTKAIGYDLKVIFYDYDAKESRQFEAEDFPGCIVENNDIDTDQRLIKREIYKSSVENYGWCVCIHHLYYVFHASNDCYYSIEKYKEFYLFQKSSNIADVTNLSLKENRTDIKLKKTEELCENNRIIKLEDILVEIRNKGLVLQNYNVCCNNCIHFKEQISKIIRMCRKGCKEPPVEVELFCFSKNINKHIKTVSSHFLPNKIRKFVGTYIGFFEQVKEIYLYSSPTGGKDAFFLVGSIRSKLLIEFDKENNKCQVRFIGNKSYSFPPSEYLVVKQLSISGIAAGEHKHVATIKDAMDSLEKFFALKKVNARDYYNCFLEFVKMKWKELEHSRANSEHCIPV